MHHEPILLYLQEELAQAWLTLEWYEQETVSLQRYQELQKQLRELTIIKSETFDRYRKAEEKLEKVKFKLDRIMS